MGKEAVKVTGIPKGSEVPRKLQRGRGEAKLTEA